MHILALCLDGTNIIFRVNLYFYAIAYKSHRRDNPL